VTAPQIITPYISVHDGAAALDWYVASLGATETVRYVGDDGRLGHAEFVLNGANIMLSDASPEIGVVAANSYEGSSCALHIEVPNCDVAHALAVAGGAESLQAPADQPHGARSATIMDPYGHRWMLSQPVHALSHDEIDAKYDNFEVVSKTDDHT
jgi:PhnB protein